MSAAASPALTAGYSRVPNSFIENQAVFTSAERAMVLIVLRRENNAPGRPVKISDETWQKWTGLEPRTKKAAIAGLAKKCLTISGRGENAGFSFARQQWEAFVQQINRQEYKPRTAGRGVDPKPGAKIHPTCRERGCGLMAAEGLSPDGSTLNVQPVAQAGAGAPCEAAGGAGTAGLGGDSRLIPLSATQLVQRVARSASDGVEAVWARTLVALQKLFPLVDVVFLVRLIAVVRALFADIQDAELAEAVGYAHSLRSRNQRSEGLFLLTVPRAVGVLRARGRGKPSGAQEAADSGRQLLGGVRMLQDRAIQALRARGAPFKKHADAVFELRAGLVDGVDLEIVEQRMQEIETAIVETARENLTVQESEQILARVDQDVKPYRALWSKLELEALRNKYFAREALVLFDIPRLSTFYV